MPCLQMCFPSNIYPHLLWKLKQKRKRKKKKKESVSPNSHTSKTNASLPICFHQCLQMANVLSTAACRLKQHGLEEVHAEKVQLKTKLMARNVNSEPFKAGNNYFMLTVIGLSLICPLCLSLPFLQLPIKHGCCFCQRSYYKFYKWKNLVICSSNSSACFAHDNQYHRDLFLTTVKKKKV